MTPWVALICSCVPPWVAMTPVTRPVGAVAVVSDHDLTAVTAVTAARQWHGTLDGHSGIPGSRDALVAGLIPAVAEDWSWPDTLRHAIALGVTADAAGEIDLDAYDLLLSEVIISPP